MTYDPQSTITGKDEVKGMTYLNSEVGADGVRRFRLSHLRGLVEQEEIDRLRVLHAFMLLEDHGPNKVL